MFVRLLSLKQIPLKPVGVGALDDPRSQTNHIGTYGYALTNDHPQIVGTGVLDGPFRTCNFYLINGYDIIYSTDALCKLKGIATLDRRGRRSLQSMKIIAVWNIMPDVAIKSHRHVRLLPKASIPFSLPQRGRWRRMPTDEEKLSSKQIPTFSVGEGQRSRSELDAEQSEAYCSSRCREQII